MAQFVEERRPLAALLQDALRKGELTLLVMHGDPKVNNIMIDDFTGKGTAMIDLDTVSPGLVHYDFATPCARSATPRRGGIELSKVGWTSISSPPSARGTCARRVNSSATPTPTISSTRCG